MKRYPILLLAIAAISACSSKDDAGNPEEGASEDAVESQAPVEMSAGNTILTAAKAKIGMTVSGEIVEGGTSNFFYFANPGKLRDKVVVRLENQSTTYRPSIKIYNDDKSQITYAYDSTIGASLERTISLNPGNSIYVEVASYSSDGAYELSAKAQKAYDEYEANDDQLSATTVKFGDAVEASIMDSSDPDWYHVTPTNVAKVTIALENLSSTYQPSVLVYNSNKSRVSYKYDSTNGAGLDFNVDLPAGQDFYVQVAPYSSEGKYRLTARPAVLADDMASALEAEGKIDLYGIYFDVDKTFIKPTSANTIAEVANLLKADPSLRVEISGHTDNTGTKDHNMTLSQGRAEAVVAALVGQHEIDPDRLEAKGYGDSKPVAVNDNASNMAKNRRVELRQK